MLNAANLVLEETGKRKLAMITLFDYTIKTCIDELTKDIAFQVLARYTHRVFSPFKVMRQQMLLNCLSCWSMFVLSDAIQLKKNCSLLQLVEYAPPNLVGWVLFLVGSHRRLEKR